MASPAPLLPRRAASRRRTIVLVALAGVVGLLVGPAPAGATPARAADLASTHAVAQRVSVRVRGSHARVVGRLERRSRFRPRAAAICVQHGAVGWHRVATTRRVAHRGSRIYLHLAARITVHTGHYYVARCLHAGAKRTVLRPVKRVGIDRQLDGGPPPPSGPPPGALFPESFGAVGDGVTDDTAALQRALDAVPSGGTLWFTAGKAYVHSDVLVARRPGETLAGPGVLLATNEARSSVWIAADGVTVDDGLTIRIAHTTQRWDAYEQMGLRIAGVSGTVLRDITVDGSAAAGIYVGQSCCTAPETESSDFLIDGVTVTNTRADGIHITGGSHDGTVQNPTVTGSGDDGVAVVSYAADGVVCNHITIDSPTVMNNTWGRGVSVVGGRYITYRNVHVTGSDAAAIYIATEGAPFNTASSEHIAVDGATLIRSNTDAGVGHGAVLIYGGHAGYAISDVTINGVRIQRTPSTAPWQVGIRSDGAQVSGVALDKFAVTGDLTPLATNISSGYKAQGWTVNGQEIPDAG